MLVRLEFSYHTQTFAAASNSFFPCVIRYIMAMRKSDFFYIQDNIYVRLCRSAFATVFRPYTYYNTGAFPVLTLERSGCTRVTAMRDGSVLLY